MSDYHSEINKTKKLFEEINEAINNSKYKDVISFFNLGYVPTKSAPPRSKIKLSDFVINKNAISLVLEVIADANLNNKNIIDMGCGRGGTLSVVEDYFNPRKIIGIDISQSSINYLKNSYKQNSLEFICGEATNIKIEDNWADIVIMIELMNSNPYILKVYSEIARVLKPGGELLHSGIFPNEYYEEIIQGIAKDFDIWRNSDITGNVLLSCKNDASSRHNALTKASIENVLDKFLIAPKNPTYDMLTLNHARYRILRLKKK